MAVDGISPALAIRSGVGVELWTSKGLLQPYESNPECPHEETKNCRAICFSPDGRFFAYTNGSEIKVFTTADWKLASTLPRPKAFHLKFSPRGNYVVTWEIYSSSKEKPEGGPNLFVYNSLTGEEVFSSVQKKQSEWEPSWSSDESLFATMVGGEAFFYELNGEQGFQSSAKKLGGGRNGTLSLGPGSSPPFLAFYVPGVKKDAPSMCKIYKYPALQQNQNIACKSFFQADRVEMLWNKRGSGLLLLTSTEVDQTGASYYGKQALHFMSTKGDSCSVALSKEGPIHSVAWSPKGNEFCVVYGYMPSKATMFNLKCDIIFELGEGSRNCAYFNDFGSLLILAGFGNLRGYIEVWDAVKRTRIAETQAPDSTLLEWSPTGETFVTATTAPRLRIANGFKVWHYSGALLYENAWPEGQELLEVRWQKYDEGVFKEQPISTTKVEGIKTIQPEASKQVYQPPCVRLMKEGKLPGSNESTTTQSPIPGLPPGYTSQNQKNTASNSNRQRKPRNRKNTDKQQQGSTKDSNHSTSKGGEPEGADQAVPADGNDPNKSVDKTEQQEPNNQQSTRPKSQSHQQQRPRRGSRPDHRKQSLTTMKSSGQIPQELQQGGEGDGDNINREKPDQQASGGGQQPRQYHQNKFRRGSRPDRNVTINEESGNAKVGQGYQQFHRGSIGGGAGGSGQNSSGGQFFHNRPRRGSRPDRNQIVTGDPEKDKRIRNIQRKLQDISKLKARRNKGETLEANQVTKISGEATLIDELKALKVSA